MKRQAFGCKSYTDKIGVIVAQLGTPDAPRPRELRRYLKQFLWDPRVIEVNRFKWWLVLNGIVLRTRPARSAEAYRRIWTESGSPLMNISVQQTDGLVKGLKDAEIDAAVVLGMRYGKPSLEEAVESLCAQGCSRILLFPMYPQYAAATSASTYDAVFAALLKRRWVPTLRVAEPYFLNEHYIQALADTMNAGMRELPVRPQKLVLSYHGIPEAYVAKGDPYCCMCTETTKALLPRLSIRKEDVIHTYQSRFGRDPWLEPYTDQTIKELARQGVKHIAVAAPGFTADCLETLDELGNENRHLFLAGGGQELFLIPCLNDSPAWISAMTRIVQAELGSWLNLSTIRAGSGIDQCPVTIAKRRAVSQ